MAYLRQCLQELRACTTARSATTDSSPASSHETNYELRPSAAAATGGPLSAARAGDSSATDVRQIYAAYRLIRSNDQALRN